MADDSKWALSGPSLVGNPSQPHDDFEVQLCSRIAAQLEARLSKAVSVLNAHLESCIEKRIKESHDGIAARIEDVAAAEVDRARAALAAAARTAPFEDGSSQDRAAAAAAAAAGALAARPGAVEKLAGECSALQQRQDQLENIMTRIASSTARDTASVRSETSAELRKLGGGVRLALERVEKDIAELKRVHDEDCGLITESYEKLRAWMWAALESLRSSVDRPYAVPTQSAPSKGPTASEERRGLEERPSDTARGRMESGADSVIVVETVPDRSDGVADLLTDASPKHMDRAPANGGVHPNSLNSAGEYVGHVRGDDT